MTTVLKEPLSTVNKSTSDIRHLRLYCVRVHGVDDDFKLKAVFGKDIKLSFGEGHQLRSKDDKDKLVPFIYTLRLDVKLDDSKNLSIYYQDDVKTIDEYHLIISRRLSAVVGPKFFHEEERNQEHKLSENFPNPDNFLFGIHFSKAIKIKEPPGINTNYYSDLCLFTYYLLEKEGYYIFDSLAHQFQINFHKNKCIFNRNSYHEFFETCNLYMINLLAILEINITALKIIVRMVGLLSIEPQNFDRYEKDANSFATKILFYVRKQFDKLFQSVNETEQVLFRSGLATLLCIELLYLTDDNSNDNNVRFLCQISDKNQQQTIANEVLLQLYKLNVPIYANSTWTDLFNIIDLNMIKLEEIYIFDSFETYIMFITKVSPVYEDSDHFYKKIVEELPRLIDHEKLKIDLGSIVFLKKFLQEQFSYDHKPTNRLLNQIQHMIKIDVPLKYKIEEYLNKLDINIENIENFGYIFSLNSKCSILDRINKTDFLQKSLEKSNTYVYCISWFKCVLAKGTIQDDNNREQWKELLRAWTKCFENDFSKFIHIFKAMDELLNAFEESTDNDWLCIYFIDHMIFLCFNQNDFYHVIVDGLSRVTNEPFRIQFKNMFDNKHLILEQSTLREKLADHDSLFSKLIEFNEEDNNQSNLICDLIQAICEKIQIDRDDLIREAFYEPTQRTPTYRILFKNSLKKSVIYKKTIEKLTVLWEEWEKDGFYSTEINTWTKLRIEKQQVAYQIWNMIGTRRGATIHFEQLIDKTKQQMQTITTIEENIKLCLNNYCQTAHDKAFYFNLLENIETQFTKKKVFSILVPDEIQQLNIFADRLSRAFSSQIWQTFFKEKNTNIIQGEQEMTCLGILKQATEILDQLINRIELLCTDIKQPLLPQLEELFPEKNVLDHELNVLETLLNENIVLYLKTLLEYWKTREHNTCVCSELINLIKQYNVPFNEKVSILENMLHIDNETSVEIFNNVYQAYRTYYSKPYSEPILNLIAEWSSSKELLEFLNSLEASDVDDLLEVVNDWDETLINTKTVLDFVLLKRFLHQADTMIESIRAKKSLELNDVIICFEQLLEENEFKNILTNFESCSKCLISIKRLCEGTTNKELSKRRRILEIMKNSTFCFCFHQLEETVCGMGYEFDVHIMNNNWEPISFDDLSALRDRARLIQHASSNQSNLHNDADDSIQQLGLFVTFVETIEKILKGLTSLNTAGYPVVKQYPMSKRKFTCNKSNYDELIKFKSDLKAQLVSWEKQLCTMYKRCIDLTYFSYQQLWMLEKSLYNQRITTCNDPGYQLLKFIGIDPCNIRLDLLPPLSKEPHDRLHDMNTILNTQHINRSLFSQEDSRINKKIFLIETSDKGILRAIYSIFNFKNTPVVANQLFYCTAETNWIEIQAFIYRCFYSQTLHQLIQPELLSLVIQDKFADLFNRLIEQNPRHIFFLSFIITTSITQLNIVYSLKAHHIMQIIPDQDMLSEKALLDIIQSSVNNNCTLVTSRIAGLGKSTYIKNKILQDGKNYVKFPITGDMNIDTLVERLYDEDIQLASSPIAIHIDIGPVQNIQQLNEFLYCLVLFRCFRLRQMPVYIANDIPIYIELDASAYLINVKDKIILFKYLTTKHLDDMNWNEININSSLAIQWVTNYLQAIENETINTKEINEETTIVLNKPTCIRLLKKYFLSNKNTGFISWTQLSIFIAVYYRLFLDFSRCAYLLVNPEHQSTLRIDILKTLINSSDQFTSLSVEKVRRNQHSINDDQSVFSFNEAIIAWDKTKPFTVIFTTTYDLLFVYKTVTDIPSSLIDAFRFYFQVIYEESINKIASQQSMFPFFRKLFVADNATQASTRIKKPEEQLQEFLIDPKEMVHEQFFLRLTLLSNKYHIRKSICEKCFTQYEYNDQQCTLCSIETALIRSSSMESQDIEAFKKILAKKLQSEYILTADNYIKMLLIYLRVQSGLPVLIMGETGCGKTVLIQFLCQKLLDDEMAIFRIHAGVTSEKICQMMRDFVRKAHKCSKKDPNKRLWVFFDEFNTTPNIGLLKEIVCERTLLGKPLPQNMVFLGACNPQRRRYGKEEFNDNIGIKNYYSKILRDIHTVNPLSLYSVVPIPETMLEYVWDYGYLDESTERSYIRAILNRCEDLTTNQNWFDCIITVIVESHKFFRKYEDVSSVSLRDVTRFCRFYNWFYKHPVTDLDKVPNVYNSINNVERASLIALFLCYYFRLNSPEKRKEYMSPIETIVKKFNSHLSSDFLDTMLQTEKTALTNRMELPPGTAANRAILDNIFVLFICILNRIPVILCGKPGSSKTSAVQIVISSLKGKKSVDPFFQTLPELVAVSYQGSQNCTSESIIKVFGRADRYIEAKTEIDLLPVIVFDEIGLAEFSPHNPLKVLHSELEVETCRHGFVGLSNWRLDASKMNRALYLSCPDPNLEDLKITAETLSKSMLSNKTQITPLNELIIESLANAYLKMGDHMMLSRKNQYYFGLRDYYASIKGIVRDMFIKDNEEKDPYKIIRYHLSINFDGTTDDSNVMWSEFCEYLQKRDLIDRYLPPTFEQLINQNILSRHGRFLMLIGDSESTFDYIQRYINIKYPLLQTRTLIGSTLADDFLSYTTYTDEYNIRILMDIILYAEKGITLFLRGLGHLYANLYDLFNQNFAVSAKKKYCRIALGSLYHPRCVIHDNFYCIVFVKQQDLDKYDPPFLNRFEKHFINTDALIHERQKIVISKLQRWINETLSMKPSENFPCPKHLFIEYSDNYIFNLVTDAFDPLNISNNNDGEQENKHISDATKHCQDRIIRTSSFDFPLLLSLKSQTNPINDTNDFIQRYYQIHQDLSFSLFINQILEKEFIPKLLIYTYTQIYHDIDYSNIKNHQQLIKEIRFSYFKTELDLIQKIKMHCQTDNFRLLCIRVDYHQEYKHISMLKHILLNEEVFDKTRGICLIFHLQRNRLNETTDGVFFNDWLTIMIDNLQDHQIIPKQILLQPSYRDLIIHLKFLTFEHIFNEHINRCFMKFRYQVSNKHYEANVNKRLEQILYQLTSSIVENINNYLPLRSLIQTRLIDIIKNIVYDSKDIQFNDWRKDLLTNEIIIGSSRSFNDALGKTISFFLDNYLALLLIHLEKYSLIDSYIFLIHSEEKIRSKLYSLWFDCWTMAMKTLDISIMSQNNIEIPLIFDLHLPCASIEYTIICQIRETIAQTHENKNPLDYAWKELNNKSIYGSFINKIFNDQDLFENYYHDQLTLAKNEANIHQLSTTFIQRLLTSKMSGIVKDQMKHLLIDYEELFIIIQIFDIAIPFIGDEDYVFQILDQQFFIQNDPEEKIIRNNNNLYCLILEDIHFYQISPSNDRFQYECQGNPFIEINLINLIELLMSSFVINKIDNIQHLILTYGLISQNLMKLSRHNHYEIFNLEKFHSFLRLASSILTLFSNEKALVIFKEVYRYSNFCTSFNTLEQIDSFMSYLKNIIDRQQSIVDKTTIQQILNKFENELLRNWLIEYDQCNDVVKFISNDKNDLWKYAGKIFTIFDKNLDLSSIILNDSKQILQLNKYKEINQYLSELNDPTRKFELLMVTRIYMHLLLDENYKPRIIEENIRQIISILKEKFNQFQANISFIEDQDNEKKLQQINLIAWLKYYLQYYVYALKNDKKDEIIEKINSILIDSRSKLNSTLKLFIIKQLCQIHNITYYEFCQKFLNRNIRWIHSMIDSSNNQQKSNARHDVILPTPLFECHDEFIRIDNKLSSGINRDNLSQLINECSTKQDTTYCFIIWFIHYYSRFYMSNILPHEQLVNMIKNDLEKELKACFEPIGYQLIVSLCCNFDEKSYFHLKPFIPEEHLHQRLLVLNIIALVISFKSLKFVSYLSFFLYNGNLQMPKNYSEHFKIFDSMPGIAVANDHALIQMLNIRTHRDDSNHYIVRCSSKCMWIFYLKKKF